LELTPVTDSGKNHFNLLIEKNKNLKEFTTFRIGGPAQFFCSVTNESELVEAVQFAKTAGVDIFILGGGSNILVSDEGFKGLVIRMNIKGMEFSGERVEVKAGENWDEFVAECVKRELYGVENLSFIPGTVGAAPVQNIGAYGSEAKDTIDTVRVYDREKGEFIVFSNFDCKFEYRDSLFKKSNGRYIIVSVTFLLKKDGKINIEYRDLKDYFGDKNPTLSEVRNAVIEIRKRKLPDVKEYGTAGSFFKNPIIKRGVADDLKAKYPELPIYPVNEEFVKVSLGWIIDKICNFKGVAKGDVGTYKNQALVLVNNGNASAQDIKNFAKEIEEIVFEKTKIKIEPEVLFI
jgi:UDP-N-acetylmuramate dehydrogenase